MSLARILLVDDFRCDLESSTHALEMNGFEVVTALGAYHALDLFCKDPLTIDALVLDNNMTEDAMELVFMDKDREKHLLEYKLLDDPKPK